MFNNSDRLDKRKYDEELALAKALSLSAESFAKEQKLRKEEELREYNRALAELRVQEEKEKEKQEKEKKDPRYLEMKNIELFLKLMKWDQMFINRGVGAGLQNLGNSCFLSATLQCLAYTTPFAQILQNGNHSRQCGKSKFCELCELETFVPSMLLNGRKIHSPKNLFRNLSKISDLLTPGCQEDAHEFLQALLDKLEMAYDDTYYIAHKKDKNFKKDPFNPIRRLFVGTTKTTVMCSKCRTVTSTEEPFSCVSLDVDSDVTLTESLSIFTHDELLRGNEKYYCEQCKRKVIARKQLTLADLPPNLIFHFKRFKMDLEAYSSQKRELALKKLCDHIEFPFEIDFGEMLDLTIHPSHQQDVLNDSVYELYGIVVHSGPKLGYGHYYAFIKSFDGKQWFRMNDMEVLPINEIKVLKEQAYLLFYRRKTHNILHNKIEQIKVKMMMDENGNPNNQNNQNNSDNKPNVNQLRMRQQLQQLNSNPANSNNGNDNNNNKNSNNNAAGPKYHWQHKSSSPTQVKSIPTALDEKVDVNFLNDSYFESSCGRDTSDVIAMRDNLNNNNNSNNNNNGNVKNQQFKGKSQSQNQNAVMDSNKNVGSQFVMVPPMATRSDISTLESSSNEDSNHSNDDLNDNNKNVQASVRRSQKASNAYEEVYWPGNDDMDIID